MQQPQPLPHQRLWRWYRGKSRRAQLGLGCLTLVLLLSCSLCGVAAATASNAPQAGITPTTGATQQQANQPTPTQATQIVATTVPTATPTMAPTPTPTPQATHYPPKTKADLQALAALGDASAIHAFHRESVGLTGVCPQPKVEAIVDPSLTGKKLAEDLLAYYYAEGLEDPCGSILFAYHSQAEANDGPYTAGRLMLDVTDSSGQTNSDPNASGLTYTLTLDLGGVLTSQQEYVVTYQ